MDVLRIFLETNWLPSSGPLTPIQQLTVTLYLLTAALCFGLAWLVRRGNAFFRYDASFWVVLGAVCSALAANRAFNVQKALTTAFRMVAHNGYWYNTRSSVQEPIVIGLIVLSLLLFFLLRWFARPLWKRYKLVTLGIAALLTLIAVRSVSLHYTDYLLYGEVLGLLHLHQLIELSALGVVIIAAIRRLRTLTPQYRPA